MKLCPKCGSLSFFNSHFQKWMCNTCEHTWREEAVSELDQLKSENSRIKLQLEKVLEAFGPENDAVPCPSVVGLRDYLECGMCTECQQCWRDALEAIGESEVTQNEQPRKSS